MEDRYALSQPRAALLSMTPRSKGPLGLFYGWWMVGIAAAVQFLSGGFYQLGFSVYFLPISRDLGLSRTAISLAFSLRSVEGGLDGPFVGYLVDRFGPRFMFRAGAILTGLGFILLAFTQEFVFFLAVFLGFIVLGMNAGVALPASSLVNHWFARQRALAVTLSHIGVEIGGTLLTPIVAILVLNVGWRQAAIFSGVAFLIVVPILTLFVRNTPESMGMRPDGDPPRSPAPPNPANPSAVADISSDDDENFTVREALGTRAFWNLSFAVGARQFAKQVLSVHLIPLLVWRGFEEQTAALLLSLFALTQIPMRIGAAHLADHWSMTRVPALAALAGVGAVMVLLIPVQGSIALGVLFALLFALGETGNSSGWAIIGDFFGRLRYGTIRGAVSMVQSLISIPAPVIAGFIYDKTESYQLALIPVACFYFLSFLLYWALRRPRARAPLAPTYAEVG